MDGHDAMTELAQREQAAILRCVREHRELEEEALNQARYFDRIGWSAGQIATAMNLRLELVHALLGV